MGFYVLVGLLAVPELGVAAVVGEQVGVAALAALVADDDQVLLRPRLDLQPGA